MSDKYVTKVDKTEVHVFDELWKEEVYKELSSFDPLPAPDFTAIRDIPWGLLTQVTKKITEQVLAVGITSNKAYTQIQVILVEGVPYIVAVVCDALHYSIATVKDVLDTITVNGDVVNEDTLTSSILAFYKQKCKEVNQ